MAVRTSASPALNEVWGMNPRDRASRSGVRSWQAAAQRSLGHEPQRQRDPSHHNPVMGSPLNEVWGMNPRDRAVTGLEPVGQLVRSTKSGA